MNAGSRTTETAAVSSTDTPRARYDQADELLWPVSARAASAVAEHAARARGARRSQMRMALRLAQRRRDTEWVR
jgi:hypothetical protein